MVARVDTVLRQELGIADGLADPRVYVLDPCCGTGAYLVEVLKRIHATLKDREDALTAQDLKTAARERVFGFEILPAPFVVSHLQLGLLLQNLGVPLSEDKAERVGVYLTNALTGWEPPTGPKKQLSLFEFQEERDAAEEVKRDKPILVILGNPPYNAFAGVSAAAEKILVEPYKEGLISHWDIKRFNLDDLYVRFFGLAERRIAGMTGKGVVCYISNFSYLGHPSFVVMRQRFLSEFDALWFDCLNGDSRETGKLTPEGKPDPSVFSTEYNREGIRVGTSVALMVRKTARDEKPAVRFRQFWGVTKRADLLESLKDPDFEILYQAIQPAESNRFSFRPSEVSAAYKSWPGIDEFGSFRPSLGILENRKDAVIDIDRSALEKRMKMYYDPKVDWDELRELETGLTQDFASFDAKKTRVKILAKETFSVNSVRRGLVRPMDIRFIYCTIDNPVWHRTRPEYFRQCWPGNASLVSRRKGVALQASNRAKRRLMPQ